MVKTDEEIAEIKRIVDGAPEWSGHWDECLHDYYDDETERNLDDLRTIVAQHDEIQRLREKLEFRENQIDMALSHNSMSYLLGQPPKGV